MTFEISSTLYRRFLWIAVVSALILDFSTLWSIYANKLGVPTFLLIMAILGVAIKIGIFFVLLTKNGPLKPLVYIWGSLFILSGVTGLLSFMISPELTPIQHYINKGLFLAIGLLLVIPFNKSVNFQSKADRA